MRHATLPDLLLSATLSRHPIHHLHHHLPLPLPVLLHLLRLPHLPPQTKLSLFQSHSPLPPSASSALLSSLPPPTCSLPSASRSPAPPPPSPPPPSASCFTPSSAPPASTMPSPDLYIPASNCVESSDSSQGGVRLLLALRKSGMRGEFRHLFDELSQRNFPFNRFGYNLLIHAFGSWADLPLALSLFTEIWSKGPFVSPDTCTYNSVIKALCCNGRVRDALVVYEEMGKMRKKGGGNLKKELILPEGYICPKILQFKSI